MSYKQKSPQSVLEGGTGRTSVNLNQVVLGNAGASLKVTSLATDGQVLIGSSSGAPDFASLTSSDATITLAPGSNSVNLSLNSDIKKIATYGWNGTFINNVPLTVTSDGTTVKLNLIGGTVEIAFKDTILVVDITGAYGSVVLTPGSDDSPVLNYVYIERSTGLLTANSVEWPSVEYAAVATVLCQSAASIQNDGPYKVHAWTDHLEGTHDIGHVNHLNYWIRSQNATWVSGVEPTLTITTKSGTSDDVIFTSSSGKCLQLHQHDFPAFSTTPDLYVVNDSINLYDKITNLNSLLIDSTGASMSGRRFSLVVWGVVSESGSDCKLMVNLPSGTYGSDSALLVDADKYANFDIPEVFKGTGFLIAQLNLRHRTINGGTWTEVSVVDLRGLIPSIVAGGGTTGAVEFADNTFRIFDDIDSTKKVAFQTSGLTTATTKTLTVQDADGTIALSNVANYGTGSAAFNAYGVVHGGTTATNPLLSASPGSIGQILASNGTSSAPAMKSLLGGTVFTKYTTQGTQNHTFSSNATAASFILIGGGGGGGSGRNGSDNASSGGGGGAAGQIIYAPMPYPIDSFGGAGSTLSFYVGAGGAGGAAVSTANTDGNSGSSGESTSLSPSYNGFLRFITAVAPGGSGGTSTIGAGGASGNSYGDFSVYASNAGGIGRATGNGDDGTIIPGALIFPCAGGGGAGGFVTGTARNGGTGASHNNGRDQAIDLGGTGGVGTAGGNGSDNTGNINLGGTGGGGAGSTANANGFAGGAGGTAGGGGGGGSGSANGGVSGAGGNGATGAIYIIEYIKPGV